MSKLVLLLVVLVTTACQTREGEPRDADADADRRAVPQADAAREEQTIRDLTRRWNEALRNQDAETIASLFADDAVALYGGQKLEGRDAIRRDSEEFFSRPNVTGSFEVEEIVISESGDLAYEVGTYSGGFDGSEGRVEEKGRYLTVWKKTPDGWRVAVDATSRQAETEEASS